MKKVNLNKIRTVSLRILPVITAAVVLISSLSFPTSAAVLDYRDYIVDIVVEGDKDLVTLYIPSSMAYWHILDHAGNISQAWTGNVAVWHTGEVHNVQFFPFGKDNVFTLDDFPDGTEVTFGIFISSQTQVLYSATDLYMVYPFSSEFGIIDTDGSGTNILFDYTFVIDRSFADGNFYVRADIDSVHSLSGGHVEYSAGPTTVTFSISSAYRDYIENGKNQELMDEIKDQLAEQNKTLEEILSGSKEDQDAADDFKDKTDSVLGDLGAAGDALESLDKPDVDVQGLVPSQLLSGSYLNYIAVLATSWNESTLTSMVTIMVGFLLISLLLHGKKG